MDGRELEVPCFHPLTKVGREPSKLVRHFFLIRSAKASGEIL